MGRNALAIMEGVEALGHGVSCFEAAIRELFQSVREPIEDGEPNAGGVPDEAPAQDVSGPAPSGPYGRGAAVPGFTAQHVELTYLARFWATSVLHQRFISFQGSPSTVDDIPYMKERLQTIAQAIGIHEVESQIRYAVLQFEWSATPTDAWRIFTKGTPDEQRAFTIGCRLGRDR